MDVVSTLESVTSCVPKTYSLSADVHTSSLTSSTCATFSYETAYLMYVDSLNERLVALIESTGRGVVPESIANTAIKDDSKASEEIPVATKPQEPEKEETHKKDIVQLTDDYVRTLENYLNNSNVKIREMGVKELMARFQEHKSRANDVALTNLLNKALQDGSKAVRFVALATLDAGYAEGDALTKEILQKMQSSKDVFGEDALMASEILLKTAGNKVEVEVPGPAPDKKDSVKNNTEKK